jgi:hypothetical protein
MTKSRRVGACVRTHIVVICCLPGIESFHIVQTRKFEILYSLTIHAIAEMIPESSLQNRHDVCVLPKLKRVLIGLFARPR